MKNKVIYSKISQEPRNDNHPEINLSAKKYTFNKDSESPPLSHSQISASNNPNTTNTLSKIDNLTAKIKHLEEELRNLREENEYIKGNNIEYCKQINEYELNKMMKIEKIEINLQDLMHLSEKNEFPPLIRRLTNNNSRILKEQKDLVNFCNLLTKDFMRINEKVKFAENVVDSLKNVGCEDVNNLINKMKEISDKNDDLHKMIIKLQKDKNNIEDKYEHLEKKYNDLSSNLLEVNLKNEDLHNKYKDLMNDYLSLKDHDKYRIYELQTKSDILEDEMRGVQSKFNSTQKEYEEHTLKLKELEDENEQLKTTFSSTFQAFTSEKKTPLPSSPKKSAKHMKNSSSTHRISKRNL